MQKSIAAIGAFVLATSVDALRTGRYASGPFVGENANASVIQQEGRSIHRANDVVAPSKYETIINREPMESKKSYHDQMWEKVFGKSQEELDLKEVAESRSKKAYKKGRLGGAKGIMTNEDGVKTIQLYINQSQEFSAVVDTASDLMALQSNKCNECSGKTYDIGPRVESGAASVDFYSSQLSYGEQTVMGTWANDVVCVGLDLCASTDLFLIEEDMGLDQYTDGILGLARYDKKVTLNQALTNPDSRSILRNLGGDDKQFATRFSGDGLSWVEFGEPSENDSKGAVDLNLQDDFFWTVSNTGFRIGQDPNLAFNYTYDPQAVFLGDGVYSIFDTSAKDMLISTLWYEPMMDHLFDSIGYRYSVDEGNLVSTCQANYPDIYFDFDGYMLQLKKEDYVFDTYFNNTIDEYCQLRFRPIDAPFNIIGMPAMNGYYIQYNYGNDTSLKVSKHNSSGKSAIQERTTPFMRSSGLDYATQNVAGGDKIAFWISFILALGFYVIWAIASHEVVIVIEAQSYMVWALIMIGGFLLDYVTFLFMEWILLLILLPGDNVEDVDEAWNAIARVKATHMTFAGIGSFCAYKLKSWRDAAKARGAKGGEKKLETAPIEEYTNNSLE